MKVRYGLIFLAAVGLFAGCDEKSDKQDDNTEPPLVTGDPVETADPNTDYQPAFEGQTRIGSVVTTTPWKKTIITSSLSSPWGIAGLPDGRLLVTQKGGTM